MSRNSTFSSVNGGSNSGLLAAGVLSALVPAFFVAAIGVSAATTAQAADITPNMEAAADKISNCVGCHSIPGYKSSFPLVYSVPMIAGQSEKYLSNALIAYRKGDRSHPTMRAIAGSLTDQDIADISAYFSALK